VIENFLPKFYLFGKTIQKWFLANTKSIFTAEALLKFFQKSGDRKISTEI